MNLPPVEQLDLEKFVDGHCNILHVGNEKAFFWSCMGISQICVDTISHINAPF